MAYSSQLIFSQEFSSVIPYISGDAEVFELLFHTLIRAKYYIGALRLTLQCAQRCVGGSHLMD